MVHRPTDPRSPIQSQRSKACLPFVLAGFAAIAFWTWQNSGNVVDWPRSEKPAKTLAPTRESYQAPTTARANLVQLFSTDDYPMEAIRNNEQGTVGFELSINRLGWVSGCRIVSSSGSEALDRATCNILRDRARFDPARDANGKRVTGQYSGRIRWELPEG